MPLVNVTTNVPQDEIPRDLHIRLCTLIAEVLSKPPERVSVSIQGGLQMCHGPKERPTAMITILSIEVFTKGKNVEYAAPLKSFLSKELGLPSEHVIIYFQDITLDQVPLAGK